MSLDFKFEKKLRKSGYRTIFGIDEVGVGPLAGKVTATAVTFPVKLKIKNEKLKTRIKNLKDSKKLTPHKREEFFDFFTKGLGMFWATASVSPKTIDKINIFEARKLASKRAALKLEKILGKPASILVLDGNARINLKREQITIVRGDEKVISCAVASIIAKVTRDREMMRYHKIYPE